ncbi:MAG: hypothetical protein ABSE20_22715 [Acetobacteraceae bacterium]
MRLNPDDEALPVMVPRNDKALVGMSANRVQRLRSHLVSLMTRMKADATGSPPRPAPEGFAARVARTACSLCRGWCCRNGADDAFLDEPTLAHAGLTLSDAEAVMQYYLGRVPTVSYQDSCIFHAERGCTLDPSMRSDVCNAYFCGGLHAYIRGDDAVSPVVVIAGERDKMRRSSVLMP